MKPKATNKRLRRPNGAHKREPQVRSSAMGMPLAKDMRSEAAKARDEWLDSAEGQRAGNPATLRTTEAAYYLRNRLSAAFSAGMEAVRRLQGGKRHTEKLIDAAPLSGASDPKRSNTERPQ